MNVTVKQLRTQFDRVVGEGWWDDLTDAAMAWFPAGEFDAATLFAIGSRETNWNPRYLREPGDNGHGFGPMQIDSRSFPDWIATEAWKIPREAIMKGAEVLRSKLDDTRAMQGKPITMRSGGQSYTVTAATLDPVMQRHVAVAAYNSGRWSLYHVSKGRDPDYGTTGKDYSADVEGRADTARPWGMDGDGQELCPVGGSPVAESEPEPGWRRFWGR